MSNDFYVNNKTTLVAHLTPIRNKTRWPTLPPIGHNIWWTTSPVIGYDTWTRFDLDHISMVKKSLIMNHNKHTQIMFSFYCLGEVGMTVFSTRTVHKYFTYTMWFAYKQQWLKSFGQEELHRSVGQARSNLRHYPSVPAGVWGHKPTRHGFVK